MRYSIYAICVQSHQIFHNEHPCSFSWAYFHSKTKPNCGIYQRYKRRLIQIKEEMKPLPLLFYLSAFSEISSFSKYS